MRLAALMGVIVVAVLAFVALRPRGSVERGSVTGPDREVAVRLAEAERTGSPRAEVEPSAAESTPMRAPSSRFDRRDALASAAPGVVVVLVDAAGRPARDLPVELDDGLRPAIARSRTDADGRARLAIDPARLDRHRLRVDIATPEPFTVPWGSGVESDGAWTIVVPSHGFVELARTDAAGGDAWLAVAPLERAGHEPGWSEVSASGARPRVAVAAGVSGVGWTAGLSRGFEAVHGVLAPLAAGEVREIAVDLAPSGARVTGRLVADDGEPIAQAYLHARIRLERRSLEQLGDEQAARARAAARAGGGTRTGADGRFEFVLHPAWLGLAVELDLVASGDPEPTARLAFGALAARHDVGDVRLAEPPLLVSGRVVDASGAPLDARLDLHVLPEQENVLIEQAMIAGATDDEGAFELRGPHVGESGLLFVNRAGVGMKTVQLDLPHTGLEIALAELLEVRGRLLLDAGIPPLPVIVRSATSAPERRTRSAPGGWFRLVDVPPGPATVLVGDADAPLAVVHDVDPLPGRVLDSTGGFELDLRGRLVAVRVRARRPDRNLVDNVTVAVPDGSGKWRVVGSGVRGEARFAVPSLPFEARVEAGGFLPLDVVVDESEIDVELEPARELRLAFTPPPPPLPDGLHWTFELIGRGEVSSKSIRLRALDGATWIGTITRNGRYWLEAAVGDGFEFQSFDTGVELTLDPVELPPVWNVALPPELARWAADQRIGSPR